MSPSRPVVSEKGFDVRSRTWLGISLAIAAFLLLGAATPPDQLDHPLAQTMDSFPTPRAVVIATFGAPATGDTSEKFTGEAAPWEANENLVRRLVVPGLAVQENPKGEVHCTSTWRLCVTVVGTTKSKSGPGTTALLAYRGWDISKAKFLLVGIAGISSWNGTIGDAGIGNIVDTNLGTDYVRPQFGHAVPSPLPQPEGWDPFDEGNPYSQVTYALPLSDWAYNLTKNVKLAVGGDSVLAERKFYGPAEANEKPKVRRCGVGGHDSFWVGADQARRQDAIYAVRAAEHGLDDQRCTSAFEDPGVAGALSRWNRLNDLVVVRTGSDFEDERPGTTPADLYDLLHGPDGFAAFGIAVENEWRVGTKIAHAWAD